MTTPRATTSAHFTAPLPAQAEAAPALRAVQRAVVDARAGLPVLLLTNPRRVVLAAETATEASLAEFRALTQGQAVLLAAPSRAASLLHQPVPPGEAAALALPPGALSPAGLLGLADPTAVQVLQPAGLAPLPEGAECALSLAKLGRLLPAMLVAEALPVAEGALLSVTPAALADAALDAPARLLRVSEARVPLADAEDARVVAFRPQDGGIEHIAVLIGQPEQAHAPLARIHSECFTGDLLGSLRCDCGPQLHQALRRMAAEGAGVLLYLAQEGRGIGLVNKLRAYALQDAGLDTLDANRALGWGADERSFAPAAAMLKALGIGRVRLLTNNPDKVAGLAAEGIEVAGRVRHAIAANGVNDGYLETKARRFGHLLG